MLVHQSSVTKSCFIKGGINSINMLISLEIKPLFLVTDRVVDERRTLLTANRILLSRLEMTWHQLNLGESFFKKKPKNSTTPHIGSDLSLLRQVWLLGCSPGATKQSGICSAGFVAFQTSTVIFIWHQHVVGALKPRTSLVLLQQSSPDGTDYNPPPHTPLFKHGTAFFLRAKNLIWWRACNAFIRLWSWWLRPWSACWPYL